MSVLHVLLLVWDVSMLIESMGEWQRWCGDRGVVVEVSVGCEYIDGTRGSGVVSSAYDVLEMSVVRGL